MYVSCYFINFILPYTLILFYLYILLHYFPLCGSLGSKRMMCPSSFVLCIPKLSILVFSVFHPQGLTSTFAAQVFERDGPNELKPPKGTPEYVKFARQLAGGLQCLMWVAACICSIAFGIEFAKGNVNCFDNVSYVFILELF